MKITAIKQQVKREGRYSIFVDDKFVFGLSELGLINSGLRLNQELSNEELEGLKDTAKIDKAYNQTLGLLARRQRSQWEITDYLKRKGYDPSLSEIILNKLSDMDYVDDLKFATAWVNNRRLLRPTSKRKLVNELRQKHLSSEIIEQALASDETDEQEELRKLVERKKARYPDKIKFMSYLAGQGFNYNDIKTVLNEEIDT